MRLLLIVLTLLLCAKAARAQTVTRGTPTLLVWDHLGPQPDHFDVRYAASDPWTPVGRLQQAPVPVLALGLHTATVRACTTQASTTCTTAALTFTVVAVAQPGPPTDVILSLNGA